MAMVKFTVDTTNKLFVAKAGVVDFDVQVDLYSDAKEHWLASGTAMGFPFPLRTVAGDPNPDGSVVEPFYYMRGGWKIRPDEADHELLVSGNIFLDQGETGRLFVPTLGGFTVLVTVVVTNRGTMMPAQGGSPFWSTTEKEQIRHRLGIDGDASAPSALPSLVIESVADSQTLENLFTALAAFVRGRAVESPEGTFTYYKDDNATPAFVVQVTGDERTRS
jgi:hypothetical protein